MQFKVEDKKIIPKEEKNDEKFVLVNKENQSKQKNKTVSGEIVSLDEFRDKK